MQQIVTPLVAQLIKVHTTLPFDQVVARLDKEVNKAGNPDIMKSLAAAKDESEVDALIRKRLGKCGFLYVSETPFHMLKKNEAQPKLVAYVIGNPLVAKTLFPVDPYATLQVPLRLMIAEKPGRDGTLIAYYLPSSVKPQSEEGKGDQALKKVLDGRLQKLVSRIAQPEDTLSRL